MDTRLNSLIDHVKPCYDKVKRVISTGICQGDLPRVTVADHSRESEEI